MKLQYSATFFYHAKVSNGNQTLHSLLYWLEMHAAFKTFLECRNTHTKPKSTIADPSNQKCLSDIEKRPFLTDAQSWAALRGFHVVGGT